MSLIYVEKYLIPGVAITRSRRDGESEDIPSKDDIKAIVANFNHQRLQVPVLQGHEPADANEDADGWILSLGAREISGDLYMFADVECQWNLGYKLMNGARGPRSIRWHDNPYGEGQEIMHLAFLGAKNPGVSGLPPIEPSQIKAITDEEGIETFKAGYWSLEKTYRSKPVEDYHDCEFSPWEDPEKPLVPDIRQEDLAMNELEIKELKAKADAAEDSKKDLERKNADQAAELEKLHKEKFDLELTGILASAPEGVRDNIKSLAEQAAATDKSKALELAKKLADDAANAVPPSLKKDLTTPVSGGSNTAQAGSRLEAHNLELATKAMSAAQ